RPRAGTAPGEVRAELHTGGAGDSHVEEALSRARVEQELQLPIAEAHLHVDVIARDFDRNMDRIRDGGGPRRNRGGGRGGGEKSNENGCDHLMKGDGRRAAGDGNYNCNYVLNWTIVANGRLLRVFVTSYATGQRKCPASRDGHVM